MPLTQPLKANLELLSAIYSISGQKVGDGVCLDGFTLAMSRTMRKKAIEGRFGWHDNEVITVEDLRKLLDIQMSKEQRNYVDIANLSMMLYYREQGFDEE